MLGETLKIRSQRDDQDDNDRCPTTRMRKWKFSYVTFGWCGDLRRKIETLQLSDPKSNCM